MSDICNCHHISAEYQEDGLDMYVSLCHGAGCGRSVVFETEWDAEDVWTSWLEAAVAHCGYAERDADDLRFFLALGGIDAVASRMAELDREACSAPSCQWW